jgi:hypothetical protein
MEFDDNKKGNIDLEELKNEQDENINLDNFSIP